jgi:alpha-glucosidase
MPRTSSDSTGLLRTQIQSPDGGLKATFYQKKTDAGKKILCYQAAYQTQPVILESELDFHLDNHLSEQALGIKPLRCRRWCDDLLIQDTEQTSHDSYWQPVYGERSRIRDHYNQLVIRMVKPDRPNYQLHLIVRVYNSGIAFHYFFPEDPTAVYYHLAAENTEFTLPCGTKAWFTPWAQGAYSLLPLSDWPDESERPLTLKLPNGLFVCLAEAEMVDYAITRFKLSESKPDTIVTSLYSSVDTITPFATPWRVIMVAEKAGDLLQNNDILLNLNPPCQIEDTTWIKPGKVIREMTLSTKGAIACIDFAVRHHLQYIGIDWGWYGVERVFASDARKVDVDTRLNPNKDLDLHQVIDYGNQNHIGVIVYVGQRALLRQIDELFPLYQSWGIKGVKFGFVQTGSHRWSVWLHEAVQKAAKYQLMVDIHDEYRPTGFSRTYPNLMTQEGIRGNEEMPDATHNTVLPFTRYIAGAADYTISYYKQGNIGDFHGKKIKTTTAHQLALAVVYYSPLQFLFWYDTPSDYQNEPEIEFFERIPTVWDDTRVLDGRIGQFITVARRSGEQWFVGTITGNKGRKLKISLDFLSSGKTYLASIYRDDPSADTRTHVTIERIKVDASQELNIELYPSGGQAVWFTPA